MLGCLGVPSHVLSPSGLVCEVGCLRLFWRALQQHAMSCAQSLVQVAYFRVGVELVALQPQHHPSY
jgi:hypothetical protein